MLCCMEVWHPLRSVILGCSRSACTGEYAASLAGSVLSCCCILMAQEGRPCRASISAGCWYLVTGTCQGHAGCAKISLLLPAAADEKRTFTLKMSLGIVLALGGFFMFSYIKVEQQTCIDASSAHQTKVEQPATPELSAMPLL